MKRLLFAFALCLALSGCDHAVESPLANQPPPGNPPPGNPPPDNPPPPDPDPDPPGVDYGPAGAPPQLGTSASYAILSALGVFNDGSRTTVVGDVGCSRFGAIVGLPEDQPQGNEHELDAHAAQAQVDARAAYEDLEGRSCNTSLDRDLGGQTLRPGVHCTDDDGKLEGTLTLDAQGNGNAVFVFKIDGKLELKPRSTVALVNGAQAKNVFWQCEDEATFASNTTFRGTVIANAGIACSENASIRGRLLSLDGAVIMTNAAVALP